MAEPRSAMAPNHLPSEAVETPQVLNDTLGSPRGPRGVSSKGMPFRLPQPFGRASSSFLGLNAADVVFSSGYPEKSEPQPASQSWSHHRRRSRPQHGGYDPASPAGKTRVGRWAQESPAPTRRSHGPYAPRGGIAGCNTQRLSNLLRKSCTALVVQNQKRRRRSHEGKVLQSSIRVSAAASISSVSRHAGFR
jgi:hypothetical protein